MDDEVADEPREPDGDTTPTGAWQPVDDAGVPVDNLDVADLALLGDVTHPMRGRLLRRLRHPRTVAELADETGVPVTRLYHHVNRLEEIGFIRVVATRRVAARTERRYQVVAKSYSISKDLLQSSDPGELAQALGTVFDVAKLDLQRSVEAGDHLDLDDIERFSVISLSDVVLTPERRVELLEQLRNLLEELRSDGIDDEGHDDPDALRMAILIAAFPSSD